MSANRSQVLLDSAVQATTVSTDDQHNYGYLGAHIVIKVTAVPGVDTVTPSIEAVNPVDGTYYTLLTGPAISTMGTTVLKVFPGIAVVANVSASDFLPQGWRVTLTHSAGTDFTYSISANLVS